MEDIIREKLCNFCINKKGNCIKYNIYRSRNFTKYTCENYIKDERKVKGYDEKWIDNTLVNLEINKFR